MQETRETGAQFLGREDPLEEGMATHSSILAWRIPWTEEPGELWSIGSQTVVHDWSGLACTHTRMLTQCFQVHLILYTRRITKKWSCLIPACVCVCVCVCVLYFNNHCYILLQTSGISLYSCEQKIDKSNHFSTPQPIRDSITLNFCLSDEWNDVLLLF